MEWAMVQHVTKRENVMDDESKKINAPEPGEMHMVLQHRPKRSGRKTLGNVDAPLKKYKKHEGLRAFLSFLKRCSQEEMRRYAR